MGTLRNNISEKISRLAGILMASVFFLMCAGTVLGLTALVAISEAIWGGSDNHA